MNPAQALIEHERKHPVWKTNGLGIVLTLAEHQALLSADDVWTFVERHARQMPALQEWLDEVRLCTCRGTALGVVMRDAERQGIISKIPIEVPAGAPDNTVDHMTVRSQRRNNAHIPLYSSQVYRGRVATAS